MLHTVNKSPFDRNALESCLRFASAGHAVLLYEDGIYGAMQGTRFEALVTEALKNFKLYVLVPDVQARGMQPEQVITGIQPIDYAGFVELVATHYPIQAWL